MQETPVGSLGWENPPGEGLDYPLQYSWAFLVAQLVKDPLAMWETWVWALGWRRERLPTPVFWPGEFPGLYRPWGHRVRHVWTTLTLHSRRCSRPSPAAQGEDQKPPLPPDARTSAGDHHSRCSSRRNDLFVVVDSTPPVAVPKCRWGAGMCLCQQRPEEAVLPCLALLGAAATSGRRALTRQTPCNVAGRMPPSV